MLTQNGEILDNRSWVMSAKYLPCWVYPLGCAQKKKKQKKKKGWGWRDDDWIKSKLCH